MLSSLTQTSLCLTWNTSHQVQQKTGLPTVISHVQLLSGESRGWVLIETCHCFCAPVWYLHAVAGFACAREEGVCTGTLLGGPLIIFELHFDYKILLFILTTLRLIKILVWIWLKSKCLDLLKSEQREVQYIWTLWCRYWVHLISGQLYKPCQLWSSTFKFWCKAVWNGNSTGNCIHFSKASQNVYF